MSTGVAGGFEFAHHTYENGSGQALAKSGVKKHFQSVKDDKTPMKLDDCMIIKHEYDLSTPTGNSQSDLRSKKLASMVRKN